MDPSRYLQAEDCVGVRSPGGLKCKGRGGEKCFPNNANGWTVYDCRGGYCPGFMQPDSQRGCCPGGRGQKLCAYKGSMGDESYHCIDSDRNCCGSTSCGESESCLGSTNTCCPQDSVCGGKCLEEGETCSTTRSSTSTSTSSSTSTTSSASMATTTLASDDILAVLRTAVPSAAQSDPTAGCFLSSGHDAMYTTPDWYSGMPSPAQSYYSSLQAKSTSTNACTADAASSGSSHGSSLSTGAIVGAVLGSVLGALLLIGLAVFALRAGWLAVCCGGSAAGAAAATGAREDGASRRSGEEGGAPIRLSSSAGPEMEMSGAGAGWGSRTRDSYARASMVSQQSGLAAPHGGGRYRDDDDGKRISRLSRLSRMSRPSTRTVSSISTNGMPNLDHYPSPPSPVWSKGG